MELDTLNVMPENVDGIVRTLRRKHQDVYDALYLKAGRNVFRAAYNIVTTGLQFRKRAIYSFENETMQWFRNLNDENVRGYGVFADLSGQCGPEGPYARFVPFGKADPAAEKLVFLGWIFVPSQDEPRMTLYAFGNEFEALNGFHQIRFTDDALNESRYRRGSRRKWPGPTK